MPKQIMISDSVAKKLDEIKDQFGGSYSQVIERLIKIYEENSESSYYDKLNDHFSYLKNEYKRIETVLELMRVLSIWLLKANSDTAVENIAKELEKLVALARTYANANTE